MERRRHLIAKVIPKERRSIGSGPHAEPRYRGHWIESSMDLRSGLDVVELTIGRQPAETPPLDIELP